MIKLDRSSPYTIRTDKSGKQFIQCDLISDNSDEVISNGTSCVDVDGIDDNMTLDFGSTAFTMREKKLLTLDSTAVWN